MIVEYEYSGYIFVFSNEDLKTGDEVYSISDGRIIEDKYVHEEYDFRDFTSGFPDEPHTILDLNHSEYKPYQTRTDHGYGPIESYFKIIKRYEKSI